jgi:hypothetical protein
MILKIKEQIIRLDRIVQLRLKFSKRWTKVEVSTTPDAIVIVWSRHNGIAFAHFHKKECPIKDLNKYIRSQKQKLSYEFSHRHNLKEIQP